MKLKLLLILSTICISVASIAQSVGINTNDPTATLDIEATNPAAPDSTTGILIPRIDAFPLSNPSIDQNGMLVFLTTDNKFYFWNNSSTSWIQLQTGVDNDNQDLSLSGSNILSLTNDGTTVNLSPYLDNTDNQRTDVFQLVGNNLQLSLQNDGVATQSVNLSTFANTDNQDLSLTTNTLSLTNDGTTVDLASYLDNTDNQDLSLTSNTLSLTNDGTTVDLSGYLDADNLGNHSATTTLDMNNNRIVDVERIGIGNSSPAASIDVSLSGTGTSAANLRLKSTNANGFALITIDRLSTADRGYIINATNGVLQWYTGQMTSDDHYQISRTSIGDATFHINKDDGFIGMGINNPQQKLHVVGTGRFSALAGVGSRMVIADANGDMSTQAIPSGDNLGNHIAATTLDMNTAGIINVNNVSTRGIDSYDKLRVWSNSSYTIGMNSLMGFGYLGDYATTFTMNDDNDRGWVWRDENDARSDGAASLTTDGRFTVKSILRSQGSLIIDGSSTLSSLAGTGNRMVIANAAGLLSTQAIPVGDITGITAGTGLTGGGTAGNVTVNAVGLNGLTTNANDLRLGGTLIQATTITQGVNNMIFNLNGTGDFAIQDNGISKFEVRDNGDIAIDANTLFIDESTNRVGIGTASPLVDLHIVGSSTIGRQIIAPIGNVNEDSELVFGEDNDATFGMKFTYDGGVNKLFLRGFSTGYTVDNTPHLTIQRDDGNIGIGTITPGQKLDVAGTTTTDGLQVGTGSTFTNMQGGTATIGAGTSVRVITVTFPSAFTSIPKVICTPRTQTGQTYTDTFSATTKQISTTQFQVNIQRVDAGSGWGQNLLLDWFAFSN